MKKLILTTAAIAFLGFPALGQQTFVPCLQRTVAMESVQVTEWTQPFPGVLSQPYTRWVQRPVERWVQSDAKPHTEEGRRVAGMGFQFFAFHMPAHGSCVGAFDSYNDRSDVAGPLLRSAIGYYTGIPMSKPKEDVEIIIMPWPDFEAGFARGRGYRKLAGSKGREVGGTFEVDLAPGWYAFVVNNRPSITAKIVSISFGGKLPTRPNL